MGILEKIFIVFIFLFPAGELLRIQFANGLAVSLNDIGLFLVVSVWLIYKLKNRKTKNNYLLLAPLALFMSIGIISLILNFPNLGINNFLVSFSYYVRYLGYLFLYFLVKDFSLKYKSKLKLYLLLSGLIMLLIGYVQFFFYPSLKAWFPYGWDEHLYRMFSTFLDPNFSGAFYSLYFIYVIDYLRKIHKKQVELKEILLGAVALLSLIAVYLTYSRSALIMLIVSVLTYLFILKKRKLIFVSLTVLILLIFVSPRAFSTEGTNLLRTVSSFERIQSVEVAAKIISQNPILGVGFNAYRYAQNRNGLNNKIWQVTHSGAGTDTSLLFVIATTGIIGFLAYLFLIYKIFYLAFKNLKGTGIMLFSVFLGLLFNSLFINSLFFVFILEWIWIISGLTENN